ncbi:MAG: 4Fe-4S binding protein [Thermoleophilia bacterium]
MSAATALRSVSSRIRRRRHVSTTTARFVVLDRSRCEACWSCVEACPEAVLGKVEFFRHRHAVVEAGERCRGCYRCVKACKAGALSRRDG